MKDKLIKQDHATSYVFTQIHCHNQEMIRLSNESSKTDKICRILLEKSGRTHKQCSPVNSDIWTHQHWRISKNLYSFAQCGRWMPSRQIAKNQENPHFPYNLMIKAGLDSDFFLSQTGCLIKAKKKRVSDNLPIGEGRKNGFLLFPRALV